MEPMLKKKPSPSRLTPTQIAGLLHSDGWWEIPGAETPIGKAPAFHLHAPSGEPASPFSGKTSHASVCFPAPSLMACSWDKNLEKELGKMVGRLSANAGIDMVLAPGCSIKRNPLGGRNHESFSEDPFLSGEIAAHFVLGVQSQGVGAALKNFVCNTQESFRFISDSIVDERALNELYLKPFEIAIKNANPWAVMASYNKINGSYGTENEELLVRVLRDKWHYSGVTLSPWCGTKDPIYSHAHGLDVEFPCTEPARRTKDLAAAIRQGKIPLDKATASAERVMNLLQKPTREKYELTMDEAHEFAIRAAEKSIVLLQNKEKALPIKRLDSLCVIGSLAASPLIQARGSGEAKPHYAPSFLDVLKNEKEKVPFAPGYSLGEDEDPSDMTITAVDLASSSKTVLLFLGLLPSDEGEGTDRETLNLPEKELSLFRAISAVNQNIIVVLNCSSPVALPFLKQTQAMLYVGLGGEGMPEALYRIIKCKVCPSGKLAETWPIHYCDVPSFGFYPGFERQAFFKESIYVGYRYYLTAEKPVAFPFGYGLSYTRFRYELSINRKTITEKDTALAKVKVTNLTKQEGEAVIQLYAEPVSPNVFKPKRVLIAFDKVLLKGNETKEVEIPLNISSFAHYDVGIHDFATENGEYLVVLGEDCLSVKDTAKLKVDTGDFFPSLRSKLYIYYDIPDDGFVGEDELFEDLLGKSVPLPRDFRDPPFTHSTTLHDIADTPSGKRFFKKIAKAMDDAHFTPEERKRCLRICNESSLRILPMFGLKEKEINVMLDRCNGYPLRALFHRFFFPTLPKREEEE